LKNENQKDKNEIDSIMEVFTRYKLLIATITLISLLVSILYAFFVPSSESYSTRVLLQVGKINNVYIETPEVIKVKLKELHMLTQNKTACKINRIKPLRGGMVRILASGNNKKELSNFMTDTLEQVMNDHKMMVSEYKKEENEKLVYGNTRKDTDYTKLIALIKKTREIQLELDKLGNTQPELTLKNTLLIKLIRDESMTKEVRRTYSNWVANIRATEARLKDTATFNSEIIKKGDMQTKFTTPSKATIISSGLVSGLILSILLAFFLSFLSSRRVETNGI